MLVINDSSPSGCSTTDAEVHHFTIILGFEEGDTVKLKGQDQFLAGHIMVSVFDEPTQKYKICDEYYVIENSKNTHLEEIVILKRTIVSLSFYSCKYLE